MTTHSPTAVRELLDAYQASETRRAFGGRWSLAGFALQAGEYLERAIAWSLDGRDPATMPLHEALSDTLHFSGQEILLVQVKRTLRRSSLIDALREFDVILSLANSDRAGWQGLGDRLRFQVVCQFHPGGVLPTDFSAEVALDGDGRAARWEALTERLVDPPIVVREDPLARCHARLWMAGVRDPDGVIVSCYGALLQHAAAPRQPASQLTHAIHGIVQSAPVRERTDLRADLLEPRHFALGEDHGDVIVGAVPKPVHVRRRCFRERGQVRDRLDREFDAWLSDLLDAQDDRMKVPVFWVGGRSGCGKSVAFLQLVGRIVGDPARPSIVRFADRVALAEAVAERTEGPLHLLAVDDAYQPGSRDAFDQALLDAVRDAAPPVAILTCGPDEQLAQFRRRLRDIVAVHDVGVPDLDDDEITEFVDWFRTRTGLDADVHRPRLGRSPMLVQLIFELAGRQDLGTFAQRFRERLEGLGAFSIARRILALNALYMHFPERWIDPRAGARLRPLMAEHHLEYSPDREGVRMAHAHLAWCLYAEWAAAETSEDPVDIGTIWAEDLSLIMERMLDEGRIELAHELLLALRVSTHASVNLGRFLPADGATVTQVLWSGRRENDLLVHLALMHRWIELERGFRAQLAPSPRLLAEQALASDELRLHLSSTALVQLHDNEEGRHAWWRPLALKWVEETGRGPGSGLILERCAAGVLDASPSLEAAVAWFRAHPDELESAKLAKRLARNSKRLPDLRDEVFAWVREKPLSAQRLDALPKLIKTHESDPDFIRTVETWVAGQADNPHLHLVLAPLLDRVADPGSMITLAVLWLEDHPETPSYIQVLLSLVRVGWASARAQSLAQGYVSDQRTQWSRVAEAMVVARLEHGDGIDPADLHGRSTELLLRALRVPPLQQTARKLLMERVEGPRSKRGTPTVLITLMSVFPGDPDITTRLSAWLADNPRHNRAGDAALVLFQHGEAPGAGRHALDWLSAECNSRHAASAYIGMLPHAPPDRVFDLAWDWAEQHPLRVGAVVEVLSVCTKHDPDRDRVERRLAHWQDPDRAQVWTALHARPEFERNRQSSPGGGEEAMPADQQGQT